MQLFWVPALRHLWYWLGMRPVSKSVIQQLLQAGTSIALCPGGVAECLHMRHGLSQKPSHSLAAASIPDICLGRAVQSSVSYTCMTP